MEVRVEEHCVGPEDQEVVGLLHWEEAAAGHADGLGLGEDGDGQAHGRLQLIDPGSVRLGGVHGFLVADHGQAQDPLSLLQELGQGGQVQPEVVGVEVAVALDVLEEVQLLGRALGQLPQDQPLLRVPGQVTALAVCGGAPGHLHEEGEPPVREVAQDVQVDGGAQVVGIADESVLVAGLEQLVQHAAGEQSRVDVPVAGRTPLLGRIRGPLHRLQGLLPDLGDLVLEEVQGNVHRELRIGGQGLEGGVPGVEAVHEDQGQADAGLLPGVEHLAHNDVQEGEVVLDPDQGLGAGHAHAGAQAAVELQHHGSVQGLTSRLGVVPQIRQFGQAVHGQGLVTGDVAGLSLEELGVVVAKGADDDVRQPFPAHLALEGCEATRQLLGIQAGCLF